MTTGRARARRAAWIGALLLLGSSGLGMSPARAVAQSAPGCPDALTQWAEACPDAGATIRLESCPAGHAIFVVGPGRLRVDVTRSPGDAFVAAGELGASPVGEFGSWDDVPELDRAAFDVLVACARERPEALVGSLDERPSAPSGGGRAPARELPPWRLALAGIAALALLSRRFGARGLAVRALPILGLGAAVFVARRLLLPESYFHQNGQGPLWIAHALGEPSDYGPGYAQVFHWAASRASDPDGAVFVVQGALAALVPGAAFAIARGVGASRAVAWAAAIAIAVSPIHARLAQGESYFATCGSLLALAAAIVASCVRPEAALRESLAGSAAAGLVIAQAALVHPLGWIAASLVPAAVLVGEGSTATRLRLAALATATIGAVVLITAGADLLAVLTGALGAQWLGGREHGHARDMSSWMWLCAATAALAVVIAARWPRYRRAGLAVALLGATVVTCWKADLLGAAAPWVHSAYEWMYLAPGLAAVAALAHELETRSARPAGVRWTVAALAGSALATHAATFEVATTFPTDAREAELVRGWRARLPPGAVVAHLERAGDQIVVLPLYDHRDVRLAVDVPPPDLTAAGRDVFVYRAGLCSTERGRAYCDALETAYVLEPIETAVLPAIPSMRGLGYDRAAVDVGLYRLRDRRSGSSTDARSREGREGR